MEYERSKQILRFSGMAASRGIAIGPAFRYHPTLLYAEDRELKPEEAPREIERLDAAIVRAKSEIEKIRRIAEQKVGAPAASIFEAQMMMVSDEFILTTIKQRIKRELRPASFIVDSELGQHQNAMRTADSPLLRERVDDVEDIKQRILRHLLDRERWLATLERPSIIVGEWITPADAILFSRASVLGFALDGGGVTSHVAILARSMSIPALVALHTAAQQVETGDIVIIDGERGELIVHPDAETLAGYERERSFIVAGQSADMDPATIEPDLDGVRTKDEQDIHLFLNLEFGSDLAVEEAERVSNALGIPGKQSLGLGLVRTEHFLLLHDEFPSEEEQDRLYKDLAQRFHPKPITLRTFDVGGDKILSGTYREENPFLGWRGMRISLDEPELFLSQLRSILRASVVGNVKILFPMITSASELKRALEFVDQAKAELTANNEPFDAKMPIGAMIEVPSAAIMADVIVSMVDFVSIGSNDLTQYTLAVDRGNDLIANMYQELHPAVLKLIDMTVRAAKRQGKPVCLCGELGSYPLATPVVLGLGIDEISVSASQVHSLASRVRMLDASECRTLVSTLLNDLHSPEEIKQKILQFLGERKLMAPFSESIVRPIAGRAVKK